MTKLSALIGPYFVALTCVGVGYLLGASDKGQYSLSPAVLSRLSEGVAAVHATSNRTLTDDDLVAGALTGITGKLDQHSAYLSNADIAEFNQEVDGRYTGIGIEAEKAGGGLKVKTVQPESPAEKAGMLMGDLITGVDGKPIKSLSLVSAVKKIRGAPGTPVELTLSRNGDTIKVKAVRAQLKYSSVKHTERDGYPILRITSFSTDTLADALRELASIKQSYATKGKPVPGLVLDLRGNAGGLLHAGTGVAGLFLKKGAPLVEIRKAGNVVVTLAVTEEIGSAWLRDVPLVVLVDAGSASASELAAGALRDNGRARLVGTRTFGKGTMQRVVNLADGSALKVTESTYYTPSGETPEKTGILPDVAFLSEVPPSLLASGEEHVKDRESLSLPLALNKDDALLVSAVSELSKQVGRIEAAAGP